MENKYDWRDAGKNPERPSNAFEAVSTGREILTRTAKTKLSGKLPYICLVLIVFFDVCNQFVQTGISSFSFGLLLNVMTSVSFSVLVFYVFFPVGKNGKAGMDSAKEIYETWKKLCAKIRDSGMLGKFREYCKKRAKNEQKISAESKIEALENMYVSRDDFEKIYKTMSKKDLKRAYRSGEITRQIYLQIKDIQKPLKEAVYNPLYILTTADSSTKNALNGKDRRQSIVLATKPAITVFCGVMMDMIAFSQKEIEGWSVVAISICISVFKIILSAFCGYHAGFAQEAHEENIVSAKSAFIGEFLEDEKNGHYVFEHQEKTPEKSTV